jgi:hypothetical protein
MARKTEAETKAQLEEYQAQFEARLAELASSPEEWLEFINTVADFGARYSARNQILLLWQASVRGIDPQYFQPYGTYAFKTDAEGNKIYKTVNGRKVAERDYDRPLSGWAKAQHQVKKDEKAFYVLAPSPIRHTAETAAKHNAKSKGQQVKPGDTMLMRFRLSPTFELSQTEPKDGAPEFEVPSVIQKRRVRVFGGKSAELLEGDDPTDVLDDLVKQIKDEGYSFEFVAKPHAILGGANGVTTVSSLGEKAVYVDEGMSPLQKLKTTVHELAHILCGHMDASVRSVHVGRLETEAESVAHIVLRALELDSSGYSDAYVLGWAEGDMKIVRATATKVVKIAQQILQALDPELQEQAEA